MVYLVSRMDLPIRLGEKGEGRLLVVKFLVVDELTAYKIILGRPTLNESKSVIIPSLILLKYDRGDGSVGSLNGDQKTTRECYLLVVKSTVASDGQWQEPIDLDKVKDPTLAPQQPERKEKMISWWR